MEVTLLALICLTAFAIRLAPRIALKYAVASDTWFHLRVARAIRDGGFRVPDRLEQSVHPHDFNYPVGYHLFLALFPEGPRAWVERGTGALFDTANILILYAFLRWLGPLLHAPESAPLWTVALYAFAPALLRMGSGPRAYNGSPRVFGQCFYFIHLTCACHAWVTHNPWSLGLSILGAAGVICSAKFGSQVLLFFGLVFTLLVTPLYGALLLAAFAVAVVLSRGYAWQVVRSSVSYLTLYAKHLQQVFLWPHIRPFSSYVASCREAFGMLTSARWEDAVNWWFREQYPVHLLLTVFPTSLVALALAWHPGARQGLGGFLIVWVFAGTLWFILTKTRWMLFIGEGERYAEYAIAPSLFLVVNLVLPRLPWVLPLLLAYSLGASVFLAWDYVRRNRALDDDFVASEPLFAHFSTLTPGVILPVGWVHHQTLTRSTFPIVSLVSNPDPSIFPLEDYRFIFSNYPYPPRDYLRTLKRYDLDYLVADRGCLGTWLGQLEMPVESFAAGVELVGQSPMTLIFRVKGGFAERLDAAKAALAAGDAYRAREVAMELLPRANTPDRARRLVDLLAEAAPLARFQEPTTSERPPRLLFIADVPDWIFDRHAHTLQMRLADSFDIDIVYQGQPIDEDAYDLIHPLEWNLVPLEQIRHPHKWVTGIRSHISWNGLTPAQLSALLAPKFAAVYVVSKRLQDLFRPYLTNLCLLPHGLDLRFFHPNVGISETPGALRLGWAGNRKSPAKGFEAYIEPLAQLPGVSLHFCGYSDTLLDQSGVRDFYERIDVYVCSSSTEGHNNSLMEAAAMGRALITTDVGTVPEWLVDGESALIVPRTPEAFEAAVARLRDDPALRLRLGQAARKAVTRYDWKLRAEDHRKLFQLVLEAADAAPTPAPVSSSVSRSVSGPLTEPAAPAAPTAFLFEPDWQGSDWVEILLAYLDAFRPGDPVALVIPLAPEGPTSEEAGQALMEVAQRAGHEAFADIALVDRPEELLDTLRNYSVVLRLETDRQAPVPDGPARRLQAARLRLAQA